MRRPACGAAGELPRRRLRGLRLCSLVACLAIASPTLAQTHLVRGRIATEKVPGPVAYQALLPAPGEDALEEGLPLLLLLHGGGGDESFLDDMRPVIEEAWQSEALPPLVVVTPAAGRSLYLDWRDGSQRWESFLLEDLLPALQGRFRTSTRRAHTLVAGISMGGLGGLRLAFKHPDRFAAVAAVEPGIEAVTRWEELTVRDTFYRSPEFLAERFGNPQDPAHAVDPDYWAANSPVALAATQGPQLAASHLAIYFECGDRDMFFLTQGAERLHRLLFDQGISHEYRLVRGADHVGPSVPGRLLDALHFLGRTLRPETSQGLRARAREALAHRFVERARRKGGWIRTRRVRRGDAELEVLVEGAGPTVVLLPSLGRGAHDFDDLSFRLASAGYRVVRPQPRGIGGSRGPLEGLSMRILAEDVAAVIHELGGEPVVLVGHAFGNRVARMTATLHPERVERVALLAAGGRVPIPDEVASDLRASFDTRGPERDRLAAIGRAFFAEGHDPAVWSEGWHAAVASAQGAATRGTPVETWWSAGGKPLLVVQPAEDRIAPIANAHDLAARFPDRVRVVEIPRAGHALLPEQPEAVAAALLAWLRGLP